VKHFVKYLTGMVVMAVVSCDSSDEPRIVTNDFFPLKTGWYQQYHVEETVYELGVAQTSAYELKTVVVDSFQNEAGRFTYVIHRSTRSEGETGWTYLDTWSASLTGKELVVQEGNIAFVKMKFPPAEGQQWNGNTYNNLVNAATGKPEDLYTVTETGEELVIDDQVLGDYVTIEQEDNQEFIVFFDKRLETYARGIGLVYREITQLHYCTQTGCLGQQIVQDGVIYKQTIMSYGLE